MHPRLLASAGVTAPFAIDQVTKLIPAVDRQHETQTPTPIPFLSEPQMIGLPVVEFTSQGHFVRPQTGG